MENKNSGTKAGLEDLFVPSPEIREEQIKKAQAVGFSREQAEYLVDNFYV
jgi:hypothetical protein